MRCWNQKSIIQLQMSWLVLQILLINKNLAMNIKIWVFQFECFEILKKIVLKKKCLISFFHQAKMNTLNVSNVSFHGELDLKMVWQGLRFHFAYWEIWKKFILLEWKMCIMIHQVTINVFIWKCFILRWTCSEKCMARTPKQVLLFYGNVGFLFKNNFLLLI